MMIVGIRGSVLQPALDNSGLRPTSNSSRSCPIPHTVPRSRFCAVSRDLILEPAPTNFYASLVVDLNEEVINHTPRSLTEH
jgi:hypothetical protein